MKKVIGLDIGGTSSKFGIVENGVILRRGNLPTCLNDDPQDFIERLKIALGDLSGVEAMGVGAPNGNPLRGTIELAPNLKWKGIVPMANLLQEAMGIPVTLTNDANAAALGELKYGSARGMKNFISVTLGTGLGSGYVVDGKLMTGHSGFAGELGQVTAIPEGRLCGCGRRGCLETYVSATGIVKTFQELGGELTTSKEVAEAAGRGDTKAIQAFDETAKIFAVTLANTVAITSPEAIFLFGGLAQAKELLINPLEKYFALNLHNIFRGTVRILPSGLPENDAAILGASSLEG
ncbi:MAG: ROK family protein [Bdellovibrionota bacterium]